MAFRFSLNNIFNSNLNQSDFKNVHVYSKAEFAELIATTIQKYYLLNDDKVSPGLLWLGLCRLFYRINSNSVASHFFQRSDVHDLKIVSKFLMIDITHHDMRFSPEDMLFPKIIHIFNATLSVDMELCSWKFITMLEMFVSIHSAYAKALRPDTL